MSSPVAARVAVDALGMTPTSYGHLQQMAARYARLRLDGHSVVNRHTGAPIGLDYERGLKNATAPGLPPALLLAVPAIPAMLAAARYLGALPRRPPYPPHVLRYRAFAAAAEPAGRRLEVILIAHEDRQHRLFLDRVLGRDAAPRRGAGGANPDPPGSATVPADDAVGANWPLAGWSEPSSGAWSFAPGGIGRLMSEQSDGSDNLLNASAAPSNGDPFDQLDATSGASKPVKPSTAGYVGARTLGGMMESAKWLGASADELHPEMGEELSKLPSGRETANKWIYGTGDVPAPNTAARYLGAVGEAAGSNPVFAAIAPGYTAASALGGEGGSDVNQATGSHFPDWLARFIGGVFGGGLYGAAKAGANAAADAATAAPKSSPPGEAQELPASASDATGTIPGATTPNTRPPPGEAPASPPIRPQVQSASGHKPLPGDRSAYNRINDFGQFRDDAGYANDPSSQNNAARDYVMQRQHDEGAEHYAAYDAGTNEVTHAGTSYKEQAATLSGDLETDLRDPNAKVTFHHGHPNNIPLGGADTSVLGMPGASWVVVHGIDGDISAARLTPEARAALASADEAAQQDAENTLQSLHDNAYEAARRPIDEAVARGELTEMEANRINAEIANRALAVKGAIEYVTTHSLPSHPAVEEAQWLANAQTSKDVGQRIPELADVLNPPPQPTSIGRAMARISGTDAGAAAGRPRRARGGASGARRAGRSRWQEDPRRDHGAAERRDSGKYETYPSGPGEGAAGETGEEVEPRVARVSGHELEVAPTSYGHLIMMTARYARARLDGRSIVNRQTHVPIALTWERGIDQIAVPGKPVAILLAVPAIPQMLAGARYLGSAPDPQHRFDISRVHGFASAVEIGGRRLDALMVVRENRQGRLTLDRMEPYAAAGARAA
jgi:hypothetical protein